LVCRRELNPSKLKSMPRDMTAAEARAFILQGTRTAKVATVRKDGAPHVMPVWFVLDGEQIVFTTARDSIKGRNLSRDPRIAVLVDDERSPYAFVHVRGRVTISEDPDELLRYATAIGARYMGAERAEEFGRRNAAPGELLVRVIVERMIAQDDVAGY
jgi:PPOX class probable F420-dependent enzyme